MQIPVRVLFVCFGFCPPTAVQVMWTTWQAGLGTDSFACEFYCALVIKNFMAGTNTDQLLLDGEDLQCRSEPITTFCSVKGDVGQCVPRYHFIFSEVSEGCFQLLTTGGLATREDKTQRDHTPTQFNKLHNELGQKMVWNKLSNTHLLVKEVLSNAFKLIFKHTKHKFYKLKTIKSP